MSNPPNLNFNSSSEESNDNDLKPESNAIDEIGEDELREIQKNKKIREKRQKVKLNIRRTKTKFYPTINSLIDSLPVLFGSFFSIPFPLISFNDFVKDVISEGFNGQLWFLNKMIKEINMGEDELSLALQADGRGDVRVPTFQFEKMVAKVTALESEYLLLRDTIDYKQIFTNYLKSINDKQIESKMSIWIFMFVGYVCLRYDQTEELKRVTNSPFDDVVVHLLSDTRIFRRVLGIELKFAYELYKNLEIYLTYFNVPNFTFNPKKTAYNLTPWARYRFGGITQEEMTLDGFINYQIKHFGTILKRSNNKPDGPRYGYKKWVENSLNSLNSLFQYSLLYRDLAVINRLDAILIQISKELDDELILEERDAQGRLINQPRYSDGSFSFIGWIHKLVNTYPDQKNIFYIKEKGKIWSIELRMLQFIPYAVRYVNELNQQILHPWF